MVRKSNTTIMRHQNDKQIKATSSLSPFTVKMIEKLEWTPSNAQQNIEQLQNPKIGVIILFLLFFVIGYFISEHTKNKY